MYVTVSFPRKWTNIDIIFKQDISGVKRFTSLIETKDHKPFISRLKDENNSNAENIS